ncbi:hypothetical protein MN116_006863 [Schistosoma mekongi]|uniref:Uncharacterized protein n=1 Tax=Schistosoma mekongi TaxID=38744 RepID=A0AAE1Z9E7_SCHME|nr:hypothetical protein MN116_006863 [Schistosoma mekongi]
MISGEVFSFPVTVTLVICLSMIQLLDGPDGEQNFEMARASVWQSRHKSDYDFDRLVADLMPTSQFEITLEMIHMVSYVKKVAPPGTLSIFPSPFQSAESWIRDRWIFRENNTTNSIEPIPTLKRGLKISGSVLPSSNCTPSEELRHKKATKVSQNSTKEELEPREHVANRSLPGFQTILQCGKTLDCDTLLSKVDSLTFNSPLDADEKVNRIFDKSQSILGKTKAGLVDDPQLIEMNSENISFSQSKSSKLVNIFYDPLGLETTNWDDNQQVVYSNKKSSSSSNSFCASDIKHNQVESKEIPLDDMSTKINGCMDDTLLLEFLDKNLAGANSKMDIDFAERCGLNSPTAFVEDMLKKAQKSLNHHYKY